MYKILLVDDERIILDGISSFIDWESIGTKLIATARNGVEAWEKVSKEQPDIIITDIKMPGMDGLELVEKVYQHFPHIRFIMLSGFGEFNFAKQAMQYGVRHYLLKPCNEKHIIEAIQEITDELSKKNQEQAFIQEIKREYEKVLPFAREQLLKEFVTSNTFGMEAYERIFELKMDKTVVKVLLFQIEGSHEYEHLFAIRNIAEHVFPNMIFSCTVREYVLMMIEMTAEAQQDALEQMKQIRNLFYQYYQLDTTVAISETDTLANARRLYKNALQCIQHRFYLGEGSMITKGDIASSKEQHMEFDYDDQKFCLLVKAGRWDEVQKELHIYFHELTQGRLDIQTTKSFVLQLFNAMIRTCNSDQMNEYFRELPLLLEMDTISGMRRLFERVAKKITMDFYRQNRNKHSAIIQRILEVIDEELDNKELSLNYIASERLFMSPDYVGKLFKKEMGERFSNYITKIKVEKAIDMIMMEEDLKIFEVAESLGYADAQYFSQVFKKHTGFTPSEYKRGMLI